MAKYVCDIDQVSSIGTELCEIADELGSSVNNYSSQLESDLSGWTGKAKEAFVKSAAEVISASSSNATNLKAVGEHIKTVTQLIQTLEEELAAFKI